MKPSLTSRLVLAMTAVAVVAIAATVVLAAPLLRGAAEDAVRAPLGRQADLLARVPVGVLMTGRTERAVLSQDLALGVVTPDGRRLGAGLALTPEQVDQLSSGRAVSATGELAGEQVIVEARPVPRDGAVVLAASSASVDAATGQLRRRMLLALAFGLLLALGTAAFVGSRITRPLGRTAAGARRMASGERGVDLPAADTREIADVVEALGTLDRALHRSESRQREFLLSVSHELRTPLTAVRGLAEGLADGTIPAEESRDVGRTMAAESQRLDRYVADLLMLARLQADDFTLRRERVDVAALVHDAGQAWAERARQAGLTLRVDAPDASLWLDTDGTRVRQALDALTDNAVRVCPEGSLVVLAASARDDAVVLEVRDSGPGLTADDLAQAFEPGVLHDRYAATRAGGHGLGLALVHRLVTRLGGTITAAPAREGGVAFTVVLPHAR